MLLASVQAWINDCNVSAHLSSRGNLIDASRECVAFLQDPSKLHIAHVHTHVHETFDTMHMYQFYSMLNKWYLHVY